MTRQHMCCAVADLGIASACKTCMLGVGWMGEGENECECECENRREMAQCACLCKLCHLLCVHAAGWVGKEHRQGKGALGNGMGIVSL
jgi:hypothetical protein